MEFEADSEGILRQGKDSIIEDKFVREKANRIWAYFSIDFSMQDPDISAVMCMYST